MCVRLLRNRGAQGAKKSRGLRAFQRNGKGPFGRVLQRGIVRDDEFVEMLVERLSRLGLCIEQQAIVETVQIYVAQDASLSVQKKGVHAASRRKLLHVIGRHGVQQSGAIVAGYIDSSTMGNIENRRAAPQGVIPIAHIIRRNTADKMTIVKPDAISPVIWRVRRWLPG